MARQRNEVIGYPSDLGDLYKPFVSVRFLAYILMPSFYAGDEPTVQWENSYWIRGWKFVFYLQKRGRHNPCEPHPDWFISQSGISPNRHVGLTWIYLKSSARDCVCGSLWNLRNRLFDPHKIWKEYSFGRWKYTMCGWCMLLLNTFTLNVYFFPFKDSAPGFKWKIQAKQTRQR